MAESPSKLGAAEGTMGQRPAPVPGQAQAILSEPKENMGPKAALEVVARARSTWLQNVEVVDLLRHHKEYNFHVNTEPPTRPPGGSLFLFDRKTVRYFRKDGHNWRKKADGKTVRETHEKLKVGKKEMLNCYYSHAEHTDSLQGEQQLQRRCYWLLEGDDDVVLVHYLMVDLHQNRPRPAPTPPGVHPMQVAVGRAQPLALPQGLEGISTSDWANTLGGLQAYRLPGSEGLTSHPQGSPPKSGQKRQWQAGTVPVGVDLSHTGLAGPEFNQRLADIMGSGSWQVPVQNVGETEMYAGTGMTEFNAANLTRLLGVNGGVKRTKVEEGADGIDQTGAPPLGMVPSSSATPLPSGAAIGGEISNPPVEVQQMVSRLVNSVRQMTGSTEMSEQQAMHIALGIANISKQQSNWTPMGGQGPTS